jgi:lipoyl(octanoyl) transferase
MTAAEARAEMEPRPAVASWHLLIDRQPRSGPENMAADAGLLADARGGAASLRIYQWYPATLSFGRNEPATRRYDRSLIERLGLMTVRRPTGGRAVWHDREVTYAVAAPASMFGTLREAYIAIHQVLAAALERLGVTGTLAPARSGRSPGLAGGACFASPVGGEIVVAGHKLVGSAQVREGTALLQHGSILLESGSQEVVERVSLGDTSPTNATSLAATLGRPTTFEEVAEALATTAVNEWPGTWSDADTAIRPELVESFADPAWTWRR